MENKKVEVIKKILKYCKEYAIPEPDFNNYKSVKKCCDSINRTCPFCLSENPHSDIICECEIKDTGFIDFHK